MKCAILILMVVAVLLPAVGCRSRQQQQELEDLRRQRDKAIEDAYSMFCF